MREQEFIVTEPLIRKTVEPKTRRHTFELAFRYVIKNNHRIRDPRARCDLLLDVLTMEQLAEVATMIVNLYLSEVGDESQG